MLRSVPLPNQETALPSLTELLSYVVDELTQVDHDLEHHARTAPVLASSVLQHTLSAGGKRIRPALTLMSCVAAGGEARSAIRAGAGIELIHTATLVHDDVIDEADLRRGRPSAPRLWGNDVSVLAGDYLFATGMRLLAQERDMDIVLTMTEAVNQMCAGQLLEMALKKNLRVAEAEYLEVVRCKTAELISAACAVGALVARAKGPETWRALADYGLNVGIAFQIIDDVLDVLADREQLGKPVGNDLREGKVTLPLIRTLGLASADDSQQIRTLLSQPELDASAVGAVTALIHRYDGVDHSRRMAGDFVARGQKALSTLPRSPVRDAMLDLAEFVIDRET